MKNIILFAAATVVFISIWNGASAQQAEIIPDKQEVVKAKVLEVISEGIHEIVGTDTSGKIQTIRIRILEGDEKGKEVTIENDYFILKKGETFYLLHTVHQADGFEYYTAKEPYRLPQLTILVLIFAIAVFIFGGIQGVRGLVSLAGSLFLIMYVLLPGIMGGYSPLLVVMGVSSLIIVLGSYVTHGFNRTTKIGRAHV